jgi:hypothetical protein
VSRLGPVKYLLVYITGTVRNLLGEPTVNTHTMASSNLGVPKTMPTNEARGYNIFRPQHQVTRIRPIRRSRRPARCSRGVGRAFSITYLLVA